MAFVPFSDASAASVYDGFYRTTDTLEASYTGCLPKTFTLESFGAFVAEPSNWSNSNDRNYSLPPFLRALERVDALQVTVSVSGDFTFITATTGGVGDKLQWTAIPPTTTGYVAPLFTNPDTGNMTPGASNWSSQLAVMMFSDCRAVARSFGVGDFGWTQTSTSGVLSLERNIETRNYVADDFDPNYPVGYDGESVRNEAPVPVQNIKPNFTFTVSDKKVTGMYTDGIPVDLRRETGVQWRLYDSSMQFIDGSERSSRDRFYPFVYEVMDFDLYYLELQLTRRPPVVNWPVGYESLPVVVPIRVDGNTYAGNTSSLNCSLSGLTVVCDETVPYEDCSVYDITVDVVGLAPFNIPSSQSISCVATNFQKWIRATSISLFVPRTSFLNDTVADGNEWFLSQFGMAKQAFDYTYAFTVGQLSATPDCRLDNIQGTFFGGSIDINFCAFQNAAPNIYNPLITLGRAALAFAMILALSYRLTHLIDEFRS